MYPSGNKSDYLEYRHFDILQPGPDSGARMLGSFIIGIPTARLREFQDNNPGLEPESVILGSISPEERRKIGLHLWFKMNADTMFRVCAGGLCPENFPERPTFGGEGDTQFWIFSNSGKEVVLKYS
jgi:hypothetical protein